MSDANPSRVGQQNLAGDPTALFLKVFGGEVLSAFLRESAFRQRHTVRTIPAGKSATFPVTGFAGVQYHTPGAEILGQNIAANERVIVIDGQIVAPVFVANVDELMNYYDVRGIYSGQIGNALAKNYDQNVGRAGILAARASANATGTQGGTRITNSLMLTDGPTIFQALINAGVALDTKDIPHGDRSAFLRPTQYALLLQSEKPISIWLNANGDNGSYASGEVRRVDDIEIVKTNNLVSSNDSANVLIPSNLQADYSPTAGLVAHHSAMGTVQLQDITMESQYDIRRQGTLMVGKYLTGHDYLRPEASVELATS